MYLVATPCYGGQVMELYMRSTLGLTNSAYERNVQVDVLTQSGESLITRARNDIFATFLAGKWTDLVFIDSDIGYQPENFWRLVQSEHDVAAKAYPLKKLDLEKAIETRDSTAAITTVVNAPGNQVGQDGFVEALDAGTGFFKISRAAAEKMVFSYPELKYTAEGGGTRWAVFDTMLHSGRYLSEDYAFCRRWQKIGGKIMVDVEGPDLIHRGVYEYGR